MDRIWQVSQTTLMASRGMWEHLLETTFQEERGNITRDYRPEVVKARNRDARIRAAITEALATEGTVLRIEFTEEDVAFILD